MRITNCCRLIGSVLVLGLNSSVGMACPFCDSLRAQQVRAGIMNDLTLTTVSAIVSPFLLATGVLLAVHFGVLPLRMFSLKNWLPRRKP
jgi:hypothetical protein